MKKKRVLFVFGVISFLLCGFACANENGFFWKKFYNSAGEISYYPVSAANLKNQGDSVSEQSNNRSAPETADIGDIFKGEDGYERVIAVSEDGAYVTEVVSP